MSWVSSFLARQPSHRIVLATVAYFGLVGACAQSIAAENNGVPGRIDFEGADLPPATVEVDLSEGMFGDLFGLGEAALAGMSETLEQSAGKGSSEETRLAAEQLAAAQQIVQLAKGVVREVRVRIYEDLPEGSANLDTLMAQFDQQLSRDQWENIVRVRDGDDNVRVSLLRNQGSLQGAFVVASDGSDLVLANVVGDISPENVKKLTSAATKIGLENGLQQVLDKKMRKFRHRRPAPVADAPAPPTSDQPANSDEDR